MLHSLPALLDELEAKLVACEDPMPLLAGVRWQQIIGWPTTRAEALKLQRRLNNLRILVGALEAPVRATLMRLNPGATYAPKGGMPLPSTLSARVFRKV
jgi:hypothetical protein